MWGLSRTFQSRGRSWESALGKDVLLQRLWLLFLSLAKLWKGATHLQPCVWGWQKEGSCVGPGTAPPSP